MREDNRECDADLWAEKLSRNEEDHREHRRLVATTRQCPLLALKIKSI